ncbi:metallophosphoesterase [Ectothiorhodospiraceae bacterium BW-2]|nr:metallophosphoesterase [Ectothiorhodospiraceae bacterium BW-2]
MKLAVFSDVHGNIAALEAVMADIINWRAEVVVMNGDLINRGPNSVEVYQLLRRTLPDCYLLQGNHESFTRFCHHHRPKSEIDYGVKQFTYWTATKMAPYIDEIASWGESLDLSDLDGGMVHITHGSRIGNREGITPEMSDEELAKRVGGGSQLFIASHTHKPLQRRLDGSLVVNTGSVGSSFDRDYRPSYGRFLFRQGRWQSEIRRVAYDRSRIYRDYESSGFLEEAGPLAQVMLMEQKLCRGLMGPWMRHYHAAVIEGEMTLEASVKAHLQLFMG